MNDHEGRHAKANLPPSDRRGRLRAKVIKECLTIITCGYKSQPGIH